MVLVFATARTDLLSYRHQIVTWNLKNNTIHSFIIKIDAFLDELIDSQLGGR